MHFYLLFYVFFACVHLYLIQALTRLYGRGRWRIVALLWSCVMVCSWYFVQQQSIDGLLADIAMVAGVWLACAVVLCLFTVLFDCLGWIERRRRVKRNKPIPRWLEPGHVTLLALGLGTVFSVYSLYEARHITARYERMYTTKLPAGTERLRLVAFSDLHVSHSVGPHMIAQVAAIARDAQPDILISLGDMVDSDMRQRPAELEMLRAMPARYGKFSVTGNHEFYGDWKRALELHELAGFHLLRGETVLAAGINIVGLDDPHYWQLIYAAGYEDQRSHDAELHLQPLAETGLFTLLLQHRPVLKGVNKPYAAAGLFDLLLSGHTHGGQIWPLEYVYRAVLRDFPSGFSTLTSPEGKTSRFYISSGAGFWWPPMRFATPPEVLILDLLPLESAAATPSVAQ